MENNENKALNYKAEINNHIDGFNYNIIIHSVSLEDLKKDLKDLHEFTEKTYGNRKNGQ